MTGRGPLTPTLSPRGGEREDVGVGGSTRSSPWVALALATLVGACHTAEPRPIVRVDAPTAEPGAPSDAQSLRIARAVRSVGAEERLLCRDGDLVSTLVTCSPEDVGSRTAQVRLTVVRSGTGVEVIADAPFSRPGDPNVCRLARRLVGAIDAELGMPIAKVHPRSGCPAPEGAAR